VTAVNTPTTPLPAATHDYTAEAFFSIEAPDEPTARRVLEDTVETIRELIETRRAATQAAGVEISLCMEDEHDLYMVEEL
jgi:uncharacterized protein (DUF2267 family)